MNIYGKVVEIREFKWGGFIILETFHGHRTLSQSQCVVKKEMLSDVKVNSWVSLTGESKPATITRKNTYPDLEFHVDELTILSSPMGDLPILVNEPEPTFSLHHAFEHRGLSLQTDKYREVFGTQSLIEKEFRKFFDKKDFVSIHTPKIVSEGAEGGTDVFSLDYFGRKAYLAQSPQFYKQICCAAFGSVYEVAPVFRAERHNTARHLNEYISMDVETILYPPSMDERSPLIQLIHLEYWLLRSLIFAGMDFSMPELLTLTMKEVKDVLGTNGDDITGSEEQAIADWARETHGNNVVFITHYHRDVRPFYTKLSEDGIHTESFDCIFRGTEITSGGQRANDHKEYLDAMAVKGLDPSKFSFYLDNFKYGFPIHGGFAIGLERLTAKLCDLPSTKMASLFPRDVDRLTP